MKTLTIYVANDGTKFDTEWECAEYEEKLKAREFADTAFIYDKDGKPLPMEAGSFDSAIYLVAKTDEAAEFMAKLFTDWRTPWWITDKAPAAGCWASFDGDTWQSAEEILKAAHIIEQIS